MKNFFCELNLFTNGYIDPFEETNESIYIFISKLKVLKVRPIEGDSKAICSEIQGNIL